MIVEAFTRAHGRLALVAKGAKRPSSNFRPVLLPLQQLSLSWSGDAEIRTLKSAEWGGGQVMPTGEALLSGYYANELLIRLLAREDAHPRLFDAYATLVHVLAAQEGESLVAAALRAFELLVLREAGHLPALDVQTLTLGALQGDQPYRLVAEGGLRAASAADRAALTGNQWQALQRALDDGALGGYTAILRACAPVAAELKPQLRALLQYHCGSPTLRTRQLMIDLQSL